MTHLDRGRRAALLGLALGLLGAALGCDKEMPAPMPPPPDLALPQACAPGQVQDC